ncbi:MAG: response regulator transcription factor [Bryobacterales bacterium]|nr:response regulator transcription factor [Bryobacterales bacterium]
MAPWTEWLKPPRKLLLSLFLLTLVSVSAVGWFGWRLLAQQRLVEAQRSQERLEQTAERMATTFRGALAEVGDRLGDWESGARNALPVQDGIILQMKENGLAAFADKRLLYYPLPSSDPELGLEDDLTMEGYKVEVVADGNSASRRAVESAFDLILLDVMLPGKDGFEVCRELRRRGMKTPILILTAKAREAEKVMGLELGADDYVTKPFGTRELRARIKALLRRSRGEERESYSFGEVEVDFARGELRRNGEVVNLTPLEFKLLELFIRSRGRVLSRERLLAGAWAPDTFASDRVVDNHIANLRGKIEPDPANPRYLRNVRGLGYRFDG